MSEARGGREIFRRKWSDEDKVRALTTLASCGGNVEETSRLTGIPAATIRFWRDRPATGKERATLAVREELLSQSLEKTLWRLGRSIREKIPGAKLAAVSTTFAALFDRWRTLRDRSSTGVANAGASAGLDLSLLSSDELRQLEALITKAGGPVGLDIGNEGGRDALAVGGPLALEDVDGSPVVLVNAADVLNEEAAEDVHADASDVHTDRADGVGVPEAAGHQEGPSLSGNTNSKNSGPD